LSAQAYHKIIARVWSLVMWLLGPFSGLDTQWDYILCRTGIEHMSRRVQTFPLEISLRKWHKCDRISLRKLCSYMGALRHCLTRSFYKNILPPFLSFVSSCILAENNSPRTKHGKTLSLLDDTRIFGRSSHSWFWQPPLTNP